ncbi:MAG: hypothetical protein M1426_04615 [Patescibacteria group bacterium]|nr:hypothetical protein [Patescibacteria group bacterium]
MSNGIETNPVSQAEITRRGFLERALGVGAVVAVNSLLPTTVHANEPIQGKEISGHHLGDGLFQAREAFSMANIYQGDLITDEIAIKGLAVDISTAGYSIWFDYGKEGKEETTVIFKPFGSEKVFLCENGKTIIVVDKPTKDIENKIQQGEELLRNAGAIGPLNNSESNHNPNPSTIHECPNWIIKNPDGTYTRPNCTP